MPDAKADVLKSLDTLREAIVSGADDQTVIGSLDQLADAIQTDDTPQETPEETVEKAVAELPEEIRKQVEDAMVKAKDAEERIAKMERENALREMIAKANADFSEIGAADEIAPLLLAAKDALDEDTYSTLERTLKAANARIDTSALYGEIGKTTTGPTDEVEAKIQELMATGLSRGEAAIKALDDPSISKAAARK